LENQAMEAIREIRTALISVYHKDNLEDIVRILASHNVLIYSTGGTLDFIHSLGIKAISVEELTGYPAILGGRVKTLHPKVFGAILARRENENDLFQLSEYAIPEMDLVVVDLYPFEQTVASGASEAEITEKIDIGGVSLIRAAAKNYRDVLVVSNRQQYTRFKKLLEENECRTSLEQRKQFAAEAFETTSHYDVAIFNHFNGQFPQMSFKQSIQGVKELRYGENPHQKGIFYGNFDRQFEQLNGKEISYNNLMDIDAAVNLIAEFDKPAIAVLKHNNACGLAVRDTLLKAWTDALAGDPVSAFGGVIVANQTISIDTAEQINKIFLEVLLAPDFEEDALALLKSKKNRILLKIKDTQLPAITFRSLLNGVLVQERDTIKHDSASLQLVTKVAPSAQQVEDMLFANVVVKHSKSNAITLAKDMQLVGSGVGQTSRVDAVRQAIDKAKTFGFDLQGAVLASDAFFPFPDSVELAAAAGVKAIIQPGGSVKDQESIDCCNRNGVAMVFTGIRHFKH